MTLRTTRGSAEAASALAEIVRRSAAKLRVPIDAVSAEEIAGRSRGTPRLANNRLRWVRDSVGEVLTLKFLRTNRLRETHVRFGAPVEAAA